MQNIGQQHTERGHALWGQEAVEVGLDPSRRAWEAGHKTSGDPIRKQIRGSSLLLVGRLLSAGVNFVCQILIARYLSTTDFGAWAYALSVVSVFQIVAVLGMDTAVPRFVPIYLEKREYNKLYGTILLVSGSALGAGGLIIGVFYAFPGLLTRLVNDKPEPIALLFIMIFLVPVEAIDTILTGLFASLAKVRTIFFRAYVLAPGLKLGVVILLILLRSEVTFLACGYLAARALGALIYAWVLIRLLRLRGFFHHLRGSEIKLPVREIFGFTLPLMTSDLVRVPLMQAVAVMFLGYFCDLRQVAYFRVVLPAVALNQIVMQSFAVLYTPAAARLFAKGDHEGINHLYWQTAMWMTMLSFPGFALTFSLARPLTVFLYGWRYEQASVVLALLTLGNYFNIALGFNHLTLRILGKVRYVAAVNVLTALTNVVSGLLLIPRYGAKGAALATAGTLILLNIFTQVGLWRGSRIALLDKRYVSFYLMIAFSSLVLFFVPLLPWGSLYVGMALTGLASLVVFAASRKNLKVAETFPELVKLPLMRLMFA